MAKKNFHSSFDKRKIKDITLTRDTAYEINDDPLHLVYAMSRYKFVAKMLEGKKNVLEIGCGDGFKSLIVKKNVQRLYVSDITDEWQNEVNQFHLNKMFIKHNFVENSLKMKFDAIFAVDVLEHIHKKNESSFLNNVKKSLNKNGVVIIGIPSLESQKYASKLSKKYHVNCKSKKNLKKDLEKHFSNVFVFSMNDEVLHTGFDHMSHYLFAICV